MKALWRRYRFSRAGYALYLRYRQARYLWTIVARHIWLWFHPDACRSCAGWGFEKGWDGYNESVEYDACQDCVHWGVCSICGRYNPWSLTVFSFGDPLDYGNGKHGHHFEISHDMERCNFCGTDYTSRVNGAPGGLPEEWGRRRQRGLKWA